MVEGSPSARAYHLRRGVLARRGWHQAAWWGGLATATIAIYLVLSAAWAGVACFVVSIVLLWLSGFWVAPGSRDAYLRRLHGSWSAWASDVQWATDVFSRESTKLSARVADLAPPAGFEGEHERLTNLLAESKRLGSDRSVPLPERTSQSLTAVAAAEQISDRLSRAASTPGQQRYSAKLRSLLAQRTEAFAAATNKAERASETAARKVSRLRAPTAVREEHVAVADAFTAYLASAREYHAAMRVREASRAEAAVRQLQVAQADLRAAGEAVRRGLDYEGRWPVPAQATDSDAEQRPGVGGPVRR